MPKIRIVRGSYTTLSGERAERGDVIEVSEEVVDRLNDPSYELVEDTEDDPTPDPTTSEDIGAQEDEAESPETDHPDVETPDPVTSADDDAAVEGDEVAETSDDSESEVDAESEEPEVQLPDDWELLQAMAVVYEGDEIKGNSSQDKITTFLDEFSDAEIHALKQKAREHLYDEPDDA